MKKIRLRVGVILMKEGRILLVKHERDDQQYWLLPGGGVEYGESLEQAARRELMEEASLQVSLGELVLVCETIPPDLHRHVVNLVFRGTILGGDLAVHQDMRLKEARFSSPDELLHLDFRPPFQKELLEIIGGERPSGVRFLGPVWR